MIDSMRTFFTKCLNCLDFIRCNKLYDKSKEDELLKFEELWGDL